MTGSKVTIEFVLADHKPERAARTVERALRGTIERYMKRGRIRHVVGSPRITAEKAIDED